MNNTQKASTHKTRKVADTKASRSAISTAQAHSKKSINTAIQGSIFSMLCDLKEGSKMAALCLVLSGSVALGAPNTLPLTHLAKITESKQTQSQSYKVSAQSHIGFQVGKLGVMSVEGHFREFSGTLKLNKQGEIIALSGEVRADSVFSDNKKRDTHILESDFLHAAQFPTMRLSLVAYEAKGVAKQANITQGNIKALLSIHGVQRQVSLESRLDTSGKTPILELYGEINIKDFGMKGAMMASNKVRLKLRTLWE